MKKRAALLLAVALAAALAAPAWGAGMWYDDAVAAVTEQGLMTGTGNGFDPDALVTRATVFQTLYNLEGRPAAEDAAWPDTDGKWYESAARWAKSAGLAQGTGAGFEGDRAVTRAEIVVILARYAQYKGDDLRAGDGVELLSRYWDAELLARWDVDAFRWAVGAGIISGKTDGSGAALAPGQNATRAELAQILVNFAKLYPGPAPAGPETESGPPAGIPD